MIHQTFWLTATDHNRLFVNQWLPETAPSAVIMLAHGMAEHSARYGRLAQALCAEGYGVYALDLRGHGKTGEEAILGHFANEDGWAKVVGDLASLNHHIGQQHPDIPILLLGHSMGSYIACLPAAPQRQPARGDSQRFELPTRGALPCGAPDRPLRASTSGSNGA